MKKQINVPSIIFSRFNEDSSWKSKKFKELLDPTEGIRRGPFGSALKKEFFVQNSEYVVYEQQNAIYDHFNTRYRISEEKYHELNKFMLSSGDFIMSGAGTIGKISLVPDGIEKGVFNQALIRLRVNKNINKEFFLQWMRSPEMQNNLTKANPASAMVNLVPMSEVKEWDVIVPSFEEQTAIGSLFRTLDDLLSSYKDNLANYQSLKATMLSKMFPKAEQTVPDIRLDGFDGEWEKVKLKDVTESIEYGLNAPAKEFDGENKYIRITDIDDVSRKFKEDSLTSPDIDVSECDNYLLCEKDILFARTGASVGKTYLYVKKDGKVYFAGFLIRARIKDKFDSKFIFQNTLTDRFTQYVKVTSQRSGQPGVNGKEYGEYELHLPNYEEQQAIGAYFSNLDNLINSYQEKISQLEILKKKLLQDMFI